MFVDGLWKMIDRSARRAAEKAVEDYLANDSEFAARLLRIMEEVTQGASGGVTRMGFVMSGAAEIRKHWPSMDFPRAMREFSDYALGNGDVFGAEGSDWTAEAARELAREYVREFGDSAAE